MHPSDAYRYNYRSYFLLQSLADGFALLFIAGLVEQGKHIALVVFYTGLVEGVPSQDISAYTAGFINELYELAQVTLGEGRYLNLDVGYTTINVSYLSTQFGHLVYFVNTLSCQEVKTVKVVFIGGNNHFVVH